MLVSTNTPAGLNLSWTGIFNLQESDNLQTWTVVPGATSPRSVTATGIPRRFFRLATIADKVIRNAKIHTVDDAQPLATTLAIKNGTLIYVGNGPATEFTGATTEIIDAGGRLVLPGFQDTHVHAVEAGINETVPTFPQFGTQAQYATALQEALASQPGAASDWVLGAGVNMSALSTTLISPSPLALIDSIIPSRPAIILDDLGHGIWANTKALQAVGFDQLASNPQGGVLGTDANGNLNGIIYESASQNLIDAAQPPTVARLEAVYQAFRGTLAKFATNGITTVSDAGGYRLRGHHTIWARAETEGTLTVRAVNAFYIYPEKPYAQQVADVTALFSNDPLKLVRFNSVKIYTDGIISQGTAALLQPYEAGAALIPGVGNTGSTYFNTSTLNNYAAAFEAAGFKIHFHATGDRGARLALDAIAHARTNNNIADRRHRITHLYMVDAADRPRFPQLGVFADFQLAPSSLAQDATTEATSFIGSSRMSGYLPLGSMLTAGADITLSSDYDADELSPFIKIKTAVTRPTQGVPDVTTAIRLMTLNPARMLSHDDRTGSLKVGKLADLIILNQDILTIPAANIHTTKVLLTLLGGNQVYRAVGF